MKRHKNGKKIIVGYNHVLISLSVLGDNDI